MTTGRSSAVLVGARAVCVREGHVCVLGLTYPPLPGPLSRLNRPLVCPVLLCLEWCVLLRLCRVPGAKTMGLRSKRGLQQSGCRELGPLAEGGAGPEAGAGRADVGPGGGCGCA